MASASEKLGLPTQMSDKTIETIKATAPVVAPKAVEITTTFYKGMFEKHPELFAFFNKANQASGMQPKTLAAAIVAYASHIDKLGDISGYHGSAVDVMCHKHCALNVLPEQYVVVHENLMGAVAEVLGEAVTPEIAAAWSESVLFLAKVLIDQEEKLYAEAAKKTGGWSGFKSFEVVNIEQITDTVKRFTFAPPKGEESPGYDFEIGQFISIKIDPNNDGLTAPRHYTLTSKPGDKTLQCTIKKVEGGVCSTYLHEKVKVGDLVELTPPFGCFTPHASENKVVLISNGIGVTPMLNFADTFKSQSRLSLVVHADSSPETHAYGDKFSSFPTMFKYSSQGGRVPADALVKEVFSTIGDGDFDYYVCGAPSFQNGVEQALKHAGATRVYSEAFKGHSDAQEIPQSSGN